MVYTWHTETFFGINEITTASNTLGQPFLALCKTLSLNYKRQSFWTTSIFTDITIYMPIQVYAYAEQSTVKKHQSKMHW